MKLLTLVAVCAALAAPAHADWQQSYRAYQEAMAAGDGQTALVHAQGAWEGSREALPPGENRAVLAQNYATLAMFSDDPEAALPPLEDAATLAADGYGTNNYDRPTLLFFQNYVRSAAAPGNRGRANAAFDASVAVPARMVPAPHTALAFRLLSVRLVELGIGDRAYMMMDRLVEAGFAREPVDRAKLQEDLSLRMFAALSELPDANEVSSTLRSTTSEEEVIGRLETVIRDWRRHAQFYDWQTSIDSYDEELATTQVSERLASALYRSLASNTRVDPFNEALPAGRYGVRGEVACQAIDHTRTNLRYPRTASGHTGAVLIGYHVNASGRVEGARVLSEIPDDVFGDAMVKQVSRWRANVDGVDPRCLRNQTVTIEFYSR